MSYDPNNLWSEVEDNAVRQFYPRHGSKWAGWSEVLPNRTTKAISGRAALMDKETKVCSECGRELDESPIRTGASEKEEHMALPELTDEQRKANLERAKRSRHERAALKASLKEGSIGAADVLADTRQCAQGMRVYDLLRSLPGYGKVKAEELMESLHIAESRRVRGLGARQREALLDALGE